jgi:hypothetical protein
MKNNSTVLNSQNFATSFDRVEATEITIKDTRKLFSVNKPSWFGAEAYEIKVLYFI